MNRDASLATSIPFQRATIARIREPSRFRALEFRLEIPLSPVLGHMKSKRVSVKKPAASPSSSFSPAETKSTVTTADVFRFQLTQHQGTTLRTAEELLGEVESLVRRLRNGDVPTMSLNINTVGRILTDHAKLVALRDALEVATSR